MHVLPLIRAGTLVLQHLEQCVARRQHRVSVCGANALGNLTVGRDPSDTSDLSPGKKRLLGQRERLRAGALVLMDDSTPGENQQDTFPRPWVICDCLFISWSVQRSHSRPLEFPDNSPKSPSATNPGPDRRAPRFLSSSRQT